MSERLTRLLSSAIAPLFVPGDRPDRFARAEASPADAVILDLEDAVAPDRKAIALENVVAHLRAAGDLARVVRVTSIGSPTHDEEIRALLAAAGRPGHGLTAVMVAKAESAGDLAQLGDAMARADSELTLIPLIESARGVAALAQIAATRGVTRLAFGRLDYSLDIDATDPTASDFARVQIVLHSRVASLAAPWDSPNPAIDDIDAVRASALHARAHGYGGQLCIHPAQVAVVLDAFVPSAEEVAWALRITDAGSGAVKIDGAMVDAPVVERARRILLRVPVVSA
jgi:citrate lyase subunit beta/citryl-CoA lyase